MLPGDSGKPLLFVKMFRQLCGIMHLGRSLCGCHTAGPPPAIGPSTPIAHPWARCQCGQMPIPPISITVAAIVTGKVPNYLTSKEIVPFLHISLCAWRSWSEQTLLPVLLFPLCYLRVQHKPSWAGGELGLLSHPVACFLTVSTSVVPCHCEL